MIATLPMYDRPELTEAHDALWTEVRRYLGQGPDHLTRGGDLWDLWQSPDLLLAQTCGLPFRAVLHGTVTLVGTPDYGLPGCAPGYYNSVFVAHQDSAIYALKDVASQRIAVNEPLSQSGWSAPYEEAKAHGITLGEVHLSGAHRASALAVAEGHAAVAAIDAHPGSLLHRYESWAQNLREVARTQPTPALPFITNQPQLAGQIFDALDQAIKALSTENRALLGLRGIVSIPASDYLALPLPPKVD
jgi:ABC-type phosphate/phosphonate transport system substrate-binding protein